MTIFLARLRQSKYGATIVGLGLPVSHAGGLQCRSLGLGHLSCGGCNLLPAVLVPVWSKISNALKRLGFQSHNFLTQLLSETSRACTIRVRRFWITGGLPTNRPPRYGSRSLPLYFSAKEWAWITNLVQPRGPAGNSDPLQLHSCHHHYSSHPSWTDFSKCVNSLIIYPLRRRVCSPVQCRTRFRSDRIEERYLSRVDSRSGCRFRRSSPSLVRSRKSGWRRS